MATVHSHITSKGQTTIPVRIREALGLKPGDRITYEVQGDRVTIRPAPTVEALAGSMRLHIQGPMDPAKERVAARSAQARHAASEGLG